MTEPTRWIDQYDDGEIMQLRQEVSAAQSASQVRAVLRSWLYGDVKQPIQGLDVSIEARADDDAGLTLRDRMEFVRRLAQPADSPNEKLRAAVE